MDTLYIIGNGFDRAHGLATQYWDFRNYIESEDWQFIVDFERVYDIESLDPTEYGYSKEAQERWEEHIKGLLWSNFENSIGFPDVDLMLSESETAVSNLDLETGPIAIKGTLDEHWKKEYGFVSKLQYYVKEWVSQLDLSSIKPKKTALIKNNNAYYFSFNYTDLLEKIYKIDNVLHIHGSILLDDSEPFMGHCNQKDMEINLRLSKKANEEFDEGEASIREAIANYLNSTYKDTKTYILLNQYFFDKLSTVTK